MISNFFTTLFRNLWRRRLFTILNIVGLSISICVAWIVFRMVSYEYSFDKKIPDAENIYQIVVRSQMKNRPSEMGFAGTAVPVYRALKDDITGNEFVVPMFYKDQHKVTVENADGEKRDFYESAGFNREQVATNTDYFKMLGYQWLSGDEASSLDAPDKVVLTDTRAAEYFPGLSAQNIVGQTIVYDDTLLRRISGVVKQLALPNSFSQANNEFIAMSQEDLTDNNWRSMNSDNLVFIKLAKGAKVSDILKKLNDINLKYNQKDFDEYHYKSWYEVLPLPEKHFEPQYAAQSRSTSRGVLRGMTIAGIFLLLLACINYINLSTSLLPARAKEIGIRKTLGSSSAMIVWRFIGETFVVTIFAVLFSFLLSAVTIRIFRNLLPGELWEGMLNGMLDYINLPVTILFLLLLVIAISLVSGIYPAWLSSRVKTVNVLKGAGKSLEPGRKFTLRKSLIVFQFLIAQVFIIGSIIIYQQLSFAMHKDMGFDKDAIITVDLPYYLSGDSTYQQKIWVMKNELLRNTDISSVSVGSKPMSNSMIGNVFNFYRDTTKVQLQVNMKFADSDYLSLYKFRLLAGRNYRPSDTLNEVVINEKAARELGFKNPQDVIGKMLVSSYGTKTYPIVGVVEDFHQFSVRSEIDPALIGSSKMSASASTLNIKLSPIVANWKKGIQATEQEWKKLYSDIPFEYKFYDDTLKQLYTGEEIMQTLINTVTLIAIIISCLGLFGLATLASFQRIKEIGIRKVLGASVGGIVKLLSREFLVLVLISVVIASPVAWWLMNKWLEGYAYKIHIGWWIFLFAALIAGLIAFATVSYQAVRAARANPVDALRSE